MTGPAALDGDVSDLVEMFAEAFPSWSVTRTDLGVWWATRGCLVREDLNTGATVEANTAAELYVRLQDAA